MNNSLHFIEINLWVCLLMKIQVSRHLPPGKLPSEQLPSQTVPTGQLPPPGQLWAIHTRKICNRFFFVSLKNSFCQLVDTRRKLGLSWYTRKAGGSCPLSKWTTPFVVLRGNCSGWQLSGCNCPGWSFPRSKIKINVGTEW